MKRLGEVTQVAAGRLIVRCTDEEPPALGSMAVDADLETVGRVVDVFGPVRRPYVTLSPSDDPDPTRLGQRLYVR